MDDLKYISFEKKDDICLLNLCTSGYLNLETGEEVSSLCKNQIEKGENRFLLDLSSTKMVNSIGVSLLIEVIEALEDKDGKLAFCNMVPIVEKTFKIMGLSDYATLFTTQEEALSSDW